MSNYIIGPNGMDNLRMASIAVGVRRPYTTLMDESGKAHIKVNGPIDTSIILTLKNGKNVELPVEREKMKELFEAAGMDWATMEHLLSDLPLDGDKTMRVGLGDFSDWGEVPIPAVGFKSS